MYTMTGVGRQYTQGNEARYVSAFDNMTWITDRMLPLMTGEAINAAIKAFKIPKVTHTASSNEAAPYGLYGIRGVWTNGTVDIFILDIGDECIPVAYREYK